MAPRGRRGWKWPWDEFKYHGDWVGPGHSDGRWQSSVVGIGSRRGIDDFDESGRLHDRSFALYGPNREADEEFYRANWGKGFKRSVAAFLVRSQNNPKRIPKDLMVWTTAGDRRRRKRKAAGKMNVDKVVDRAGAENVVLDGYLGNTRRFNTARLHEGLEKSMMKKGGVKRHIETVFSNSGTDICPVGHHNMPYVELIHMSVRCIVRYLLKQSGWEIIEWHKTVEGVAVGDSLSFRYHPDPADAAIGAQTYTILVTDTYYSVATNWANLIQAALLSYPDIIPLEASHYTSARNSLDTATKFIMMANLRLDSSSFVVSAVSRMNIQNVTSAENSTEDADLATNVHSVPLEGKMYQLMNTNYAQRRGYIATPIQFTASSVSGCFENNEAVTGTNDFSEPVSGYQWYNCKKASAVQLNPGEIKTSQFASIKKFRFRNLYKNYEQRIGTDDDNPGTISYGHFRMFMFEKMVNSTATTPVNITLACNHDLVMVAYIKKPGVTISRPIVSHGTYDNTLPA